MESFSSGVEKIRKKICSFDFHLLIRWVLVTAIFLFLGKMVWDNWNQVRDASFTFKVIPFALSILLCVFSYLIQVWAWYLITVGLEIALSPSETLESWFYSQFGKYLPGKIWLVLGRFYFYHSKGKSKKNITMALYVETVTMIAAAGLIFLAVLIGHREIELLGSGGGYGWLVLLLLLGLFFPHPKVLQAVWNWFFVRWGREPISLSISYTHILWILFVSILSWIFGGIAFYLFIVSFHPIASGTIPFLTGALAASSMLGLLAIFAPSGLGVREGTLVYLLSFVMATPVAVIVSILTRIWMTVIEIGLIGMIYLAGKFQKQGSGKGDVEKEEKPEDG